MKENNLKGYILLFWGMLFVLVPYILVDFIFSKYEGINALEMAFWGFFGTALAVAPYFSFPRTNKLLKKEWNNNKKTLLKISFLTSIGSIFWFYSLQHGTSGLTAFLGKSDVLFSFILGVSFLKEKFSKTEIIYLLISVGGFFLISQLTGETTLWAVLAVVASSFLYAFQSYLVKKSVFETHSPSFTFLRLLFLILFLGIWGILSGKLSFIDLEPFILVTIAQISGVFFYRVFYFEAHKHLPISQIGFFSLIQPVLIFITNVLLLNEPTSSKKILGFSIILIGILLFLGEKFRLNRKQKLSTIPKK